jgi:hypothetical protein
MAIDINIETQVSQTITDGVTDKAPSENAVFDALANKVDKETGKGLSEENFTIAEKNKLAGIEAGAEVNVNADWNATSGDAEILNKPTIPSVTGLVPYTGAVADVDLGTHKLTAKDLEVNHSSGSGDAATITKGGNGEALKVVKSSGSGNAASITGGVTLLDELNLTTKLADAEIASAATWNAKIGGAVAIGQVAFGTAAGVIGGDAGLTWDNVNKRLGVGTTSPTARLHVQAQGALSTDIAFRVRNSAGTLDIIRAQGDGSVFVGQGALGNNTTGSDNTANGVSALFGNTTGSRNTAIGVSALRNNATGSDNIAIGFFAGRFIADGVTPNTITTNSIFLGGDARPNANNQTNQIVIGHNAIGAGSNTVTLGNTSIVDTVLRGRVNLTQYATGSRPTYVKGALIYDSTLGKLLVGGNSGWEIVTSI